MPAVAFQSVATSSDPSEPSPEIARRGREQFYSLRSFPSESAEPTFGSVRAIELSEANEPVRRIDFRIYSRNFMTSSHGAGVSQVNALPRATSAVRGLDRSGIDTSLLELAERAVDKMAERRSEDVELWAERLAEDVRGVND